MAPQALACDACGLSFPPSMLACPRCNRLAHTDRLKALSAVAEAHSAAGEVEQALTQWRDVLALLPPGTRQHTQVASRIQSMVAKTGTAVGPGPAEQDTDSGSAKPKRQGALAGLSAAGLLLWKFKAVFGFVLTKGKILLLGLTKGSTFLSMLLSMGVYWAVWGWQFAVGLVLSIYVHEMGHVVALRRLGIASTAPMFIPGLGAVIRSKQYPASEAEDAQVGLAGPIWGFGCALACYLIALATGYHYFLAMAKVGAWINLFNLLPIWQLDGGRGFRALARRQRWVVLAVIALAALYTNEGMLVLLLLVAGGRTFMERGPQAPDRWALTVYAGLVLGLAWLCNLHVPTPEEALLAM